MHSLRARRVNHLEIIGILANVSPNKTGVNPKTTAKSSEQLSVLLLFLQLNLSII